MEKPRKELIVFDFRSLLKLLLKLIYTPF